MNHDRELLNTIIKAHTDFLDDPDPRAVFTEFLKAFLSLTDSEYGFIGEVLHTKEGSPYLKTVAITNIAWNEETKKFYDENAPEGLEFYNLKTLFGQTLVSREAIISNNPAGDPHKGGIPEGHPPLNGFLGVPIFFRGEMVGMAGLANKPNGYSAADIELLNPLLLTCGNYIRLLWDDREAKAAKEALLESENRLAQIADNSLMWIWEVDKDGLYTYCNDTCEHLLGYTSEEIVGHKYYYDFFHPEDKEELKKSAFEVFNKRVTFNEFENRNISKSGDDIWLLTSGVPVIDSYGNLQGYRGADIDITERKKLMAEQSRASQLAALGTVAAGVAHEINNPINGIINYSTLLEQKPNDPEMVKDIAGRIQKESNRIAKITADLLSYSKDNRTEKSRVDIIEVIEGALSLVTSKIRKAKIVINTDFEGNLPKAFVNPQSIQQIIINLVDNACDALRYKKDHLGDPAIHIRCSRSKKASDICCIEVYDNGVGMTETTIQKAKDAFYTTKPSREGAGLGLSIVHDIVTKHNGSFLIESNDGEYTNVKVSLPFSGEAT